VALAARSGPRLHARGPIGCLRQQFACCARNFARATTSDWGLRIAPGRSPARAPKAAARQARRLPATTVGRARDPHGNWARVSCCANSSNSPSASAMAARRPGAPAARPHCSERASPVGSCICAPANTALSSRPPSGPSSRELHELLTLVASERAGERARNWTAPGAIQCRSNWRAILNGCPAEVGPPAERVGFRFRFLCGARAAADARPRRALAAEQEARAAGEGRKWAAERERPAAVQQLPQLPAI